MAKGSAFERQFCKELSLWWTNGKSDCVFWRTAMSGGRATVRAKSGKQTKGHCGDICAMEKEGIPFTRRITLELKRGYNKASMMDLIDVTANAAEQTYTKWIKQASNSSAIARTPYWMIVHQRDRRVAMVTIPFKLYRDLDFNKINQFFYPIARFTISNKIAGSCLFYTFPLSKFLADVSKEDILDLSIKRRNP